jgi:tetratricopeptide (TPR) repeat protein
MHISSSHIAAGCLIWLVLICGSVSAQEQHFDAHISDRERLAYQQFPEGSPFFDAVRLTNHLADLLAEKPDSFVAALLRGRLKYEQGNYPAALYHLKRARELVESLPGFQHPPQAAESPHWHALVLYRLALTYMAMDRLKDELAVLETYAQYGYERFERRNGLLRPASFYHIRVLLKLGQTEKAYRLARAVAQQPRLTEEERQAAQKDLTLVEEFRSRDTAYEYTQYATLAEEVQQAGNTPSGSLWNTLAYFALLDGRYQATRQALERSTRELRSRSSSHPYNGLAKLFVLQADWPSARQALRQSWQWLEGKRSYVRQELTKETQLALAVYYLATGYPDSAWRICSILLNNPVRSGFRWRFSEQWEAGFTLVAIAALRQQSELDAEQAAAEGWLSRSLAELRRLNAWARAGWLQRKFRALLARRLARPLPVISALECVEAPSWLFGELAQALGGHGVRQLLRVYPLTDTHQRLFADALDTELAYLAGDWQAVIRAAGQASTTLPEAERLWRARIAVMHAHALRQTGRPRQAISLFAEAYRINPAVFRHLNVRLPVSIQTEDAAFTDVVKNLAVRSPRLQPDGSGLVLRLTTNRTGIECKLLDKNILIVQAASETEAQFRSRAANELRRRLFSAGKWLEQADYDALEGRALRGPQEDNEAVKRVLQ